MSGEDYPAFLSKMIDEMSSKEEVDV